MSTQLFFFLYLILNWLQKLAGVSLPIHRAARGLLIMQGDGETLIFDLNAFALTVWCAAPRPSQRGCQNKAELFIRLKHDSSGESPRQQRDSGPSNWTLRLDGTVTFQIMFKG